MKRATIRLVAVVVLFAGEQVWAGPVVLTFEGFKDEEPIGNYYNGGLGGLASGPGPNYGITFSSNSRISIESSAGGIGDFTNAPSGVAVAFFLMGTNDFMDVPSGFTNSISFFYTASDPGSVNIYSGLDGTGTLLATVPLFSTNNNGPPGAHSNHWVLTSATFSGTAESVDFSNAANVGTKGYGVDNLTISPLALSSVPEPASFTLIGLGIAGLLGYGWRRRQRRV
jgi:hypothetical protein